MGEGMCLGRRWGGSRVRGGGEGVVWKGVRRIFDMSEGQNTAFLVMSTTY